MLAIDKEVLQLEGIKEPPEGMYSTVFVLRCKTPDHFYICTIPSSKLHLELHMHLAGFGSDFTQKHGVSKLESVSFYVATEVAKDVEGILLQSYRDKFGNAQVAGSDDARFAVYVLRCKTSNHFYIGMTKEFLVRILRHFRGTGANFTKRHGADKIESVRYFKNRGVAQDAETEITKSYIHKYGINNVAGSVWSKVRKGHATSQRLYRQ